MDQTSFDRIARLLGGAATRRQGLAAALAGALGLAAATGERDAASRRRKRRPRLEGPCGDGTRKDNVCTKNSDCCTNICNKELGQQNNDGNGRCRCMKRGQSCKTDRNCCNTLTCNNEVCGPAVVCTVCASGCPYTTVEAAYAAAVPGSVISIGAGTYPTQIVIDKNITLEACGDAAPVLTPSRASVTDSYYVILAEDSESTTPRSVTLSGLTLTGTGLNARTAVQESLLYAEAAGNITWTIRNSTFSNAEYGLHTAGSGHVIENSIFTRCGTGVWFSGFEVANTLSATGCTFSDCLDEGFVVDYATATLTNCTVTGNKDSGCGVYDGNLTLASTRVSGNSSTSWGGGVFAQAGYDDGNATLTFTGTTLVTGNTAPEASGLGVVNNGIYVVSVVGVNNTNVTGNTPGDQCETSPDSSTWTPVANCAY